VLCEYLKSYQQEWEGDLSVSPEKEGVYKIAKNYFLIKNDQIYKN